MFLYLETFSYFIFYFPSLTDNSQPVTENSQPKTDNRKLITANCQLTTSHSQTEHHLPKFDRAAKSKRISI
ncbi:hypothetical protein DB891_07055 [Flavobacterium laiguense]|uniref:Uncharacterized protein n=1 Tax=Flavobacterium laiguense TaxID=2169409 RepID=A0A2U1JXQ2_9FLAO|nr:hypothetical protein DB891_07055 [Flavobacterium laiguense]